jgi:adenylate kinase family enzyme
MRRVLIVGTSGAGKTTLARRLAARLNAPPVDLDELFWEPGWKTASDEVFRARLEEALLAQSWVVSGNYSRVQRDLLLPRADAVIWLDYPFVLVLWRIISRTARRCAKGETCCNGNREEWRRAFSRDSVILWAIRTYSERKRAYTALFCSVEHAHLQRVRLKSPREAEQWLSRANP